MFRIAVLEDELDAAIRVASNLLAVDNNEITIHPFLFNDDSAVRISAEVSKFEIELKKYIRQWQLPTIEQMGIWQATEEFSNHVLRKLALLNVDLIVSDSQMGRDDEAGAKLLNKALTESPWLERRWKCCIATQHDEIAVKFLFSQQKRETHPAIEFIPKKAVVKSPPAFVAGCEINLARLIRSTIELKKKREVPNGRAGCGLLVGSSMVMNAIYDQIEEAAQYGSRVLITGESGTGKELAARAIHGMSQRKDKSFVAQSCPEIPHALCESTLFGHRKGAFTGATEDRIGVFQAADSGTLFLDEIGELPIDIQPKLLRALEEKAIKRMGDTRESKVNVRIIAATNRSLEDEIKANKFREDLYYRLNVIRIEMPALREHRGDIPLIADAIVKKLSMDLGIENCELTSEALNFLEEQRWPGNARQLRNVLERALNQCARLGRIDVDCKAFRGLIGESAGELRSVFPTLPGRRNPFPDEDLMTIWEGLRDNHTYNRLDTFELEKILGRARTWALAVTIPGNLDQGKVYQFFNMSSERYRNWKRLRREEKASPGVFPD